MNFGPVPVGEALGAILAHSVQAAKRPYGDHKRYKLSKGTLLEQVHLEDLQQDGVESVTVARLEEGDVHEDAAAKKLAEALVKGHDCIGLSVAKTGRVNVRALEPGLVDLDEAAIHAVNRVNAGITAVSYTHLTLPTKRIV